MQRAIDLANRAGGYNAPNPRVGAVVVHQDKIIGEGYHERCGEGHAEVNAIASVRAENRGLLAQSTIYVTLEPCFHYGKTPPCVNLILKHKIPRVVIACKDPYEEVAGQSIKKLQSEGIEVLVGVLEKEAAWMVRRFFTTVEKKRPYVLLKFAQSKDGFMGDPLKEIAISNPLSKRLVHQWRREETAIMVGTNTAAIDNPKLNNRLCFGRTPLRLVLDRQLRLPDDLYLFDNSIETWVFTAQKKKSKINKVRYVSLDFDANLLPSILAYLHEQKIQSVLIEGGQQLLQGFLDANLWDEAKVLCSNAYLEQGIRAPEIPNQYLTSEAPLMDNWVKTYVNDF
ncbi:MAG: Diaminohydroxyphosphoribosylaminopyrimidine deaminase (EC / 5-amino-6-(5-phosphoribosylamino)uracil reductase (EC [uncultured Aureispira sp.]|uniref:Riboflavin biosynthesis protein RibD n=1 Tax=uncultured Aureispira sp. TaxID=1331704 RepID=A0A6S6SKN1_9BACT|nr:MAG: Diaminohydroxyphosphoribosylaminopyrimidine deaminase (EC / 5-amino-6-(5-phosphoribosylamino)uracil reductase (EC [uncultured Aureispira sp.]